MKRNVSLEEISDGKLYGLNDMVKADCNDCQGCFTCCTGMGDSIILDPFDIYRLVSNLNLKFEELLQKYIALNVVEGIILPNIKMSGNPEGCSFLSESGRCSIHPFRPGICRLFPLGRYYENHSFQYFLQVHECEKKNKTKIKVRKWIDTPDPKNNEQFIIDWHYFLEEVQELVKQTTSDERIKEINLYVLNQFYITAYDKEEDFYQQIRERIEAAKSFLFS